MKFLIIIISLIPQLTFSQKYELGCPATYPDYTLYSGIKNSILLLQDHPYCDDSILFTVDGKANVFDMNCYGLKVVPDTSATELVVFTWKNNHCLDTVNLGLNGVQSHTWLAIPALLVIVMAVTHYYLTRLNVFLILVEIKRGLRSSLLFLK